MQTDKTNNLQAPAAASSFTEIFNQYQERFILFANSYVRNQAVAEDICMEAMLIYWEKRDSLQPGTNIPGFLFVVHKNLIIPLSRYS